MTVTAAGAQRLETAASCPTSVRRSIPDDRVHPASKPVITFDQQPIGAPEASSTDSAQRFK